jgi:small GTP-binding protein
MIVRKVCLVGTFAVGKTSLATRFLTNTFPGGYLPTVGVRVGSREVDLAAGDRAKLVVWDIAGHDELTTLSSTYLKGAAGIILVADGTRAITFLTALRLRRQSEAAVGAVPAVMILNKTDLPDDWEVADGVIADAKETGLQIFVTSAKTGDGVVDAFKAMAELVSA